MADRFSGKAIIGMLAIAVTVLVATLIFWPGKNTHEAPGPERDYVTLEWTDLLPQDDLDALLNPPEWLDEIEDGAPEDTVDSDLLARDEVGARFQQALVSTNVMEEFDRQAVRVPGFVVPLDFDEKQQVTEFFLVPYFGACIHLPPPPPNQMIHVSYPQGLPLERLDDAVWVEGVLTTAITDHDLGTAAYAISGDAVLPYMELFDEH